MTDEKQPIGGGVYRYKKAMSLYKYICVCFTDRSSCEFYAQK